MPRGWLIAILACIWGATAIAYIPAMRGDFIWDDDAHVVYNPALETLAGLRDIWIKPGSAPQYYPMAHTGFWVQYQLFGENPFGYKLVNVLLHCGSASILLLLLLRLRLPGHPWSAALAAAVFALHPVHVESVAWISELKNTLSGLFYVAATLAYVRFARLDEESSPSESSVRQCKRGPWPWYAAALLLFTLALLTKTVTASLPAALLLVIWWKRGRLGLRDVMPLAPFFVLGLVLGLVTVWFERKMVGAEGVDFDFTVWDRLLIAGRASWFYLAKILWPGTLVFIYPRWDIDASIWWQWLYPIGVAAALAGLLLGRKRIGRGPLAAMLFFGGTLFPALGFFNVFPFVYSFVADHFQYHASLGIIVLVSAIAVMLLQRLNRPKVAIGVCMAILLALGARTWAQGHVYRDLETLYRHIIANNPTSWMAYNNLGGVMLERGDMPQAHTLFHESLRHNPRNAGAMRNLAQLARQDGDMAQAIAWLEQAVQAHPQNPYTHNELGELHWQHGDPQRAIELFTRTVELLPNHPLAWYNLALAARQHGDHDRAIEDLRRSVAAQGDLTMPRFHLATLLALRGDDDEALEQYEAVLALRPEFSEAMAGIGNIFAKRGRTTEAIEQFRRAIELTPQLAEAHNNLGQLLLQQGREDEAESAYRQALAQRPDFAEAHFNLANLLANRGEDHVDVAIGHLQQAILAAPDFVEARNNLGVLLVARRRYDQAIDEYRQAVALQPDYAEAHNNLGVALWTIDRRDEAIEHYRHAVRLRPGYVKARFNLGDGLAVQSQTAEAIEHLREVIRLDRRHTAALRRLASLLVAMDEHDEAATAYRRLIQLDPLDESAHRELAWLLATHGQADPAQAMQAVQLADRAVRLSGGRSAHAWDTLSIAYAAARRFNDATTAAQRALDLARQNNDNDLASAIEARLIRYRQQQ